jgi:hypothetical protein
MEEFSMKKSIMQFLFAFIFIASLNQAHSFHGKTSFFKIARDEITATASTFIDKVKSFGYYSTMATALTGVGLGCLAAKQYYDFYKIDRYLNDSIKSTITDGKKFKFSGWQIHRWQNAKQIHDDYGSVIDQLKKEKKLNDKIYIFDPNNIDARINNPTLGNIRDAINNEKLELESMLLYLSSYTHIPRILLNILKNDSQYSTKKITGMSTHEQLLLYCIPEELQNTNFKIIGTTIGNKQKKINPTPYLDTMIYRPIFFDASTGNYQAHSNNPLRWSFSPFQNKAGKLYLELLERYLRLMALKNIADSIPNLEE